MKKTLARVHNTPTSLEQQTFTTEVAFGLDALHAGPERSDAMSGNLIAPIVQG